MKTRVIEGPFTCSEPLGDLEREIERLKAELASHRLASDDRAKLRRALLVATARLHHGFSFDQVSECERRLHYEPRCSTACTTCETIWVGSKAGEILRLQLASRRLDGRLMMIEAGVRALVHVHRRQQLIAGLDTGHLMLLSSEDLEQRGFLHVATSRPYDGTRRGLEPRFLRRIGACKPGACGARDAEHPACPPGTCEAPATAERFSDGVTALLELPPAGRSTAVVLAIATRAPALLIARLDPGGIRIHAEHPLPAWSRVLTLTGPRGSQRLVCITRAGDVLEWSCRALHERPTAKPIRNDPTGLSPTAVATPGGPHRDDGVLLLGASDGLYVHRPGRGKPRHVVVTRSAVLSIATVQLSAQPARRAPGANDRPARRQLRNGHAAREGTRDYVALGLEDGRLRVIEERAVFNQGAREVPDTHDFSIGLGDAVLTLEILEADEATSRFVFAVMRDHRLRLFHVRSRDQIRADLDALWREVLPEPAALSPAGLSRALSAEHQLRQDVGEDRDQALRYLLVDAVLPRWADALQAHDEQLVARACEVARGADDKVLYRLSTTMGQIARGDPGALIRLSLSCLAGRPRPDPRKWRAFVSYHLKHFHEAARATTSRPDVTRLRHWARFVRKYLLLGETFAGKRYCLRELMDRNEATHKFLDALIYAAQLAQQRFDLKWSTVACKDDHGVAQEIFRVDLLDDYAIVVTTSAEIVFLDVSGTALEVVEQGAASDRLTVERGHGASGLVSTRAARFMRSTGEPGTGVHLALSWKGESKLPAGELPITLYDIRFVAAGGRRRVEVDRRAAAIDGTPGAADAMRAAPSRPDASPGRPDLEVHSITGLPEINQFLVGLNATDAPLGVLTRRADQRWVLTRLALPRPHGAPSTPSATPPTPVRAIAAIPFEGHQYLAAAGADDGSLRFVVFGVDGQVSAADEQPTQLAHRVNDISLAARAGDPDDYGHVCHVGTEAGVSLCLLVKVQTEKSSLISTKQLWRDLHTAAVIAVRPTASAAGEAGLLYPEGVVFVATRDGHLSIYHAGRAKAAARKLTAESANYYFEGMRLDRINLPDQLRSWAIRRSKSGFLAAYPGGVLMFGELHAPRESQDYAAAKRHVDELYHRATHAELFFGAEGGERDKLEISAMIRIGRGALRSYVFGKQLVALDWSKPETVAIWEGHLKELNPEIANERDRIKVVLEAVASHALARRPDDILDDYRAGRRDDRMNEYPRVLATVLALDKYLMDASVQGQRGAVRVRMAILKALFHVNIFRHAALDVQGDRYIVHALATVLTTCLRDDAPVVRVEALRGVAVALRNISVMLARATGADGAIDPAHVRELRLRFFPLGLGTIQWLLDTVIENYARYRQDGEPVLLSAAWTYTTVLAAVIRLFPDETLALCEQLSQRGLGDSLEIVADRLRGATVASLRRRICDLWLVTDLCEPAQARARFIGKFGECDVGRTLRDLQISAGEPDHGRATALLHVYRRLALLWKVDQASDIGNVPVSCRHGGELPELVGGFAGLKQVFDTFVSIARADHGKRGADLRARIQPAVRDCRQLPAAVRLVLDRIVSHWQAICEPPVPTAGQRLGGVMLQGPPIERDIGIVYKIDSDATRCIKVLRYPHDPKVREAFHRDARLSRELAERYPDSFIAVERPDPDLDYLRLENVEISTESVGKLRARRPELCAKLAFAAASDLSRALRCLHEARLSHGDLRAENVFTTRLEAAFEQAPADPATPDVGSSALRRGTFRLGDLHVRERALPRSQAASMIPNVLLTPSPSCAPEVRVDLMALTLFLYWVLNGEPLDPVAAPQAIRDVAKHHDGRRDSRVERVIARMLGPSPCDTAAELERELHAPELPPEFQPVPLAGRPLARFDVFLSYDSLNDEELVLALHARLKALGYRPYLDKVDALADWRPDLTENMNKSRAFVNLVGAASRPGPQLGELQTARKMANDEQLPLMVFQLDDRLPEGYAHDAPIRLGRDVEPIAARVIAGLGGVAPPR